MHVPSTVNQNCLKVYEPTDRFKRKWQNKVIRSFQFDNWNNGNKLPKRLRELCIECIAKNWQDRPILQEIIQPSDRYLLLELLSHTLPLELTIPRISDEVYWKRCYVNRWPLKLPKLDKETSYYAPNILTNNRNALVTLTSPDKSNIESERVEHNSVRTSNERSSIGDDREKETLTSSTTRTWKKHYCEMHVKDYLENLKPEDYNPEKIKELCDLCGSYVQFLTIDEMMCSENSPNKIPLHAVVTGFPNLSELSLRFKQTNARNEFSWNMVHVSCQDVTLLARGLNTIRLQAFRITNSDIDCDKTITIAKSLLQHRLVVLDLSHCKVGDRGMIALSRIASLGSLKELYLTNNRIGSKGIKALSYALTTTTCNLTVINLGLNQFCDQAGNLLVETLTAHNRTLKRLIMAGCGLAENSVIYRLIKYHPVVEVLDVSNNVFDEVIGVEILEALKLNSTLLKLNIRMCNIPSYIELLIQEAVYKNSKMPEKIAAERIEEFHYSWDPDLLEEMEQILNTPPEAN